MGVTRPRPPGPFYAGRSAASVGRERTGEVNIGGTFYGNGLGVANFTFIAIGPAFVFTDTSSLTPTAWAWNFGDGSTSTARNPSHTYGASGTYSVTLVAQYSSKLPSTFTLSVVATTNPCLNAVTLDFEVLGKAALAAGTPVGTTYLITAGVTFSDGFIANHNGMPGDNTPAGAPPTRANNFGFVGNAFDSNVGVFMDATMSFDPRTVYTIITLDWASYADLRITVFDAAGANRAVLLNGNAWAGWANVSLSSLFGDNRRIDHVLFSTVNGDRFTIDNIYLC